MPTVLERFESFCAPEPNSGCWLWTGGLRMDGYARFWDGRQIVRGHRWAFERLVGPVPAGLVLDHKCRIRSCVNPAHLEAVTQRENLRRGEGPPGTNCRRTHCRYGHEFTVDNTRIRQGPYGTMRVCRECDRLWQQQIRAERKAR